MSLLNRAAIRKYILDTAQTQRPAAGFTRVAAETYDTLEARLRQFIRSELQRHPSNGRTVKF